MLKKMIAIGLVLVMVFMTGCAAAPTSEPREEAPAELEAEAPTTSATEEEAPAVGSYEPMDDVERYSGDSYLSIDENKAKVANEEAKITLSLKADTASYTNVARYINDGLLPPRDAVKTEELINYFSYKSEMGEKQGPFQISTEVGPSPFDDEKQIAFLRVKTDEIDRSELPPSNLTFLIDTSGSMDSYDKLPLLKEAFGMLVDTLSKEDRISIVTYAGSMSIPLDSASGDDDFEIMNSIYALEAGGSTYGEGGIQIAYKLAEKNYIEGGNNRIILATDGDFNVGVSSLEGLERLISEKRDSGIQLSVLGFGTGNLRDDNMETLSKHGDGNYSYIGSVSDAKKVLVDELGSTLFTVASDVKAQVEFNPNTVESYRMIGYENRTMANEDFADDTKDAGEIGAGTDVVVMFELALKKDEPVQENESLFELRIRYKDPGEGQSKEVRKIASQGEIEKNVSEDFKFACAVAGFGYLLRESDSIGTLDVRDLYNMAKESTGDDVGGYRSQFIELLRDYTRVPGAINLI